MMKTPTHNSTFINYNFDGCDEYKNLGQPITENYSQETKSQISDPTNQLSARTVPKTFNAQQYLMGKREQVSSDQRSFVEEKNFDQGSMEEYV